MVLCYCRVLRGVVPKLFKTGIKVGKMRELADGEDVLIITAGITTEEAMARKTSTRKSRRLRSPSSYQHHQTV